MHESDHKFALVVDDEPIIGALLEEVLESQGFDVETALRAREARDILEEYEPDIVIIDLDLGPGPSGSDLSHYVSKTYPHIIQLILTKYPDLVAAGMDECSLPSGTSFLAKEKVTNSSVLIEAVDKALREEPVNMSHTLSPPLEGLSVNQLQVLRMVAQGYTNTEISRRRKRTEGAIEKVLTSTYDYLGFGSDDVINRRTEAVRYYCKAFGPPPRQTDDLG